MHVVLLLLVVGCGNSPGQDEAKTDPPPAVRKSPPPPELPQRYESNNKLIVARFPPGFEVETTGKSTVLLSGEIDGHAVAFGLVSIGEPISDKLPEFDQAIQGAIEKTLEGYVQISSSDCTLGGVTGVEHVGTFVSKGIRLLRHACHFLRHGHGYAFSFSVPASSTQIVPQAKQIRAATEFKD